MSTAPPSGLPGHAVRVPGLAGSSMTSASGLVTVTTVPLVVSVTLKVPVKIRLRTLTVSVAVGRDDEGGRAALHVAPTV